MERFDRRSDGSRVHHEDLCQALGFRPLNKYGDHDDAIRFEGVFASCTTPVATMTAESSPGDWG